MISPNRSAIHPPALLLAILMVLTHGCSPSGSTKGKPSQSTGGSPTGSSNSQPSSTSGETKSDGHDPDDVPITEKDIEMPRDFAALVARVEQLTTDIRERISAGTPTKAHRSLDELDIILKKAAELASQSVSKEHWKEINLASKELAAAHNELHEAIDAKLTPNYEAVGKRIHESIETLKSLVTK